MITLRYVQAAEGPAADRTADFAELRRQLDVADADIALVNKWLDRAHTTREKASSSAGFRCISSAGTGATNKAL